MYVCMVDKTNGLHKIKPCRLGILQSVQSFFQGKERKAMGDQFPGVVAESRST